MTSLDTTPRSGADTFARYAMILSAVVSPLTIALSLLLSPSASTADSAAYVKQFGGALDSWATWSWISALGAITLIPGLYAISRVGRRGRPTLGLVGMILAFFMALPLTGNTDDVLYVMLKNGVDVGTATKIYDGLSNDTPTGILGFGFFLGLLGVLLLGVAALLGKSAPAWAAVALIVGPVLVPIAWLAALPATVAAVAWLVMTVGMGGVSLGLLTEPAGR
ncbi:hypothetical protein OIE66_28270 [Nonomuraea sp. NBC_01738]|uniref:hypothetical protein n=1 Tax=Nonomuraea sp. NBC_01738 TaxID=2976003 RepID=UPI002E10A78C|nr:hypothetical protein OIE66_28270 [Nonomuraea sp. NBC_01738]